MSTEQEHKNERKKNPRPRYPISSSNSFLPPPKELKGRKSLPAETKKSPAKIAVVLAREFTVCNKKEDIESFMTTLDTRMGLVLETPDGIALAHIDSPNVDSVIATMLKGLRRTGKGKSISATIIGGRNAASKQLLLSINEALKSYNIYPKEHLSTQNVSLTPALLFMSAIALIMLRMYSNIFDYTPSYGIVKTEHLLLAVLIIALINHLNTPYGLTVHINTRSEPCLSIRPTSNEDRDLNRYVSPAQLETANIAPRLDSFKPGNLGNYREIKPRAIVNTDLSPTDIEKTPALTEEDERVDELVGGFL